MTQKPRNYFWLSFSNVIFPDGNKENGGIRNAKPVCNTVVFNLFQAAEHAWSLLSKPKMQTFFSQRSRDIRNLPRRLTRTRVGRRDGSPCRGTGSVTRKRFNSETPFQSAKDVKSAPLKCIRDKKNTKIVLTHCKKHPVFFYLKKIKSFF